MRPILKNGTFSVEMHKADRTLLGRVRELGALLTEMKQDTGKPLTEAVDAILEPSVAKQEEEDV